MPTADRTTIGEMMADLLDRVRADLVSDPPTVQRPFRRVMAGSVEAAVFARPYLSIRLMRVRPVAAAADDRLIEALLAWRIVADAAQEDAHAAILAFIAVVEDWFDGLRDTGWVQGADAFDGRAWELHFSQVNAGPRVVAAEATMTCVLRTARAENGS